MPTHTSIEPAAPKTSGAYLEHYPEQGGHPERITLAVLPFSVGRAESNDQRVYAAAVSKHHAVFLPQGDGCCLRDLGSTNGTFVNGTRIVEHVLADGDIIHLGPVEFCFRSTPGLDSRSTGDTVIATQALPRIAPESLIRGSQRLRELIDAEAVDIEYQPIVDLHTREIRAFEALARGRHPSLSRNPSALIRLAEECGMAIELSQLFRRLAVVNAARLRPGVRLFLNVHPRELDDDSFLRSLEAIQRLHSDDRSLVLEIAEASVINVTAMSRTRDALTRLGFEFAYDDFGAGQARFLELTDIPPHFLKLDIAVIRGIEAVRSRQDVVRALLGVVGTLGVQVVAEGIESEPCALTCQRLGCHLGQGFLFGAPAPI